MPWLKLSDRFATHPVWARLRTVRRADERTVNEVVGFVTRCATQASGHMTDYAVDLETAEMMGKARAETLLRQGVQAGLLTVEGKGPTRRWRIVEDEDLWQMRARDDVLWERQRDRDRKNPDLTMPVLKRDGDVCRYCGVVVNWKDTRSGRGGTFDHRQPGEAATVATYVVSCRSCNGKRLNDPHADDAVPLCPAPSLPYFSSASGTLARLEKHYGAPIPHIERERPELSDTATTTQRDPAPGGTPRATTRPGPQPDTATPSATPQPAGHRDPSRPETPIDHADPETSPPATPPGLEDTAGSAATREPRWDTATGHAPGTGPDTAGTAATRAPEWAEPPPDHSGTTPGTRVVEGWNPGTGRDGQQDGTGAPPGQPPPPGSRKSRKRGRRGRGAS